MSELELPEEYKLRELRIEDFHNGKLKPNNRGLCLVFVFRLYRMFGTIDCCRRS
jgi:hypothetical protein